MTRNLISRLGGLVLAALAFSAGTAHAQGGMTPAQRQVAQACSADIRSHCANVQRGGGRIIACLRENSEKLSSACRDALSAAQR